MSTRVFLPDHLEGWISQNTPLADLGRIEFRVCRRIPFWWVMPGQSFAGLTLWNRVYLVESCWVSEPLSRYAVELVLHELIHVVQYRRNPLVFPLRYVIDHLRYGYADNPFEVEARDEARRLAQKFWESRSQSSPDPMCS